MKKHKNLWLYVVLVALGINAIYSHMKIADLESYIENTRNYAENESISIRNNINNIYQNVDAQLEKGDSFLSHFEIREREIDTSKHILMIDLDVIPKEVNNQTKLTLQYKDETYAFKREGDVFTTSFAADLFSSYKDNNNCFVKIENNNQTKIQKLEDIELSNVYQRYLPNLTVSNFSEKEKTKENIVVNLDLTVHIPSEYENSEIGYNEFYLVSVIKKEVKNKNITKIFKNNDSYHDGIIHFSNRLTLNANDEDEVNVYLEAIDELGYTHSCLVYSTNEGFDAKEDNDEIIKDKDGKVLTNQE